MVVAGMKFAVAVLAVLLTGGCSSLPPGVATQPLTWQSLPLQPVPVGHIPEDIRLRNWSARSDGSGSCVYASHRNAKRATGDSRGDAYWDRQRQQAGWEGGETLHGLLTRYRQSGQPYIATEDTDMRIWEIAGRARRPGVISYLPRHAQTCFGIQTDPQTGERIAVLLDNNRTGAYTAVDADVFRDAWRYCGGWGVIPWDKPATPFTFSRFR